MKKQEIIDMLKEKNQLLLDHFIYEDDAQNIKKHTAISEILKQKNGLDKVDGVIAINIMISILKNKELALKTYKDYMLAD